MTVIEQVLGGPISQTLGLIQMVFATAGLSDFRKLMTDTNFSLVGGFYTGMKKPWNIHG